MLGAGCPSFHTRSRSEAALTAMLKASGLPIAGPYAREPRCALHTRRNLRAGTRRSSFRPAPVFLRACLQLRARRGLISRITQSKELKSWYLAQTFTRTYTQEREVDYLHASRCVCVTQIHIIHNCTHTIPVTFFWRRSIFS